VNFDPGFLAGSVVVVSSFIPVGLSFAPCGYLNMVGEGFNIKTFWVLEQRGGKMRAEE
jgi:hypothetical protein